MQAMAENIPPQSTVLIKGAGEKGSAVAHRLYKYGFRTIAMTDLPAPRSERRGVCFCEALYDGSKTVAGVVAEKACPSLDSIRAQWAKEHIPVIPDPGAEVLRVLRPDILIDGVMAKKNKGTGITDAPLVIALGPGFVTGKDAHLVVETNPASTRLGQVLSEGQAEPDTGIPESICGLTRERLIRSPASGVLKSSRNIGDKVEKNRVIGFVEDANIVAPMRGVIWGLMRDGLRVKIGQKIGDVDPRGKKEPCFQIAPQAGSIAEGVLRSIVRH